MKHILVATDFSKTANNAVDYAVELAKATNASITLFHVLNIPVMANDVPSVPHTSITELEKDGLQLLKKLRSDIALTCSEINIDIDTRGGYAHDEINKMARGSRYQLIVMGINGHGMASQLFGSTATSVAGNAKIPVLIVPTEAKFKTPEKIIFAFDYQEIKKTRHMDMLLKLAAPFNAKVHVLNIAGKAKEPFIEGTFAGIQVDDILYNTRHTLSTPTVEDTIQGIEHYLKINKSEMLVMIERKHGFFDWLFHGNNTMKMAFHTHIPLLVLHD